jgi:DNA polymerase-3 subunit delta'
MAATLLSANSNGINTNHDVDTLVKIERGSHPDCSILSLGDKNSIGIEEVRLFTSFIKHTAIEGQYKVAIIDPTDNLTLNASNALLKVLEEPTPNSVLILVCNSLGRIPVTVRSRCRIVPIPKPSITTFTKAVNDNIEEKLISSDITDLYELTSGSIGLAINIIERKAHNFIAKIKNCIIENKNLETILDLKQTVAANPDLWPIFCNIFVHFSQQTIKNMAIQGDDYSKALVTYDKNISMLTHCDKLHLDKNSTLVNLFSGE